MIYVGVDLHRLHAIDPRVPGRLLQTGHSALGLGTCAVHGGSRR